MADNTIFDDVFRTMLEKMPVLIIPVINEVFHTSYSKNEEIVQYRNEHHLPSGGISTDSYFRISDKLYHLECQSTADSSMSIRMIEYDFSIALEGASKTGDMYEMNFPHSCVVYLRHNSHTPDHLKVKVNLPDENFFIYQIPTLKVQEYTRDDIFQKKLLFFLPFYIIRYEKLLNRIEGNPALLGQMLSEFETIRKQLKENLPGDAEADLYTRLVELIKRISDYILQPSEQLKERIGDIMGGKVLELETDRIIDHATKIGLERGLEQGLEQGLERGLEQGLEQGLERGLEQGLEQATSKFVRRMLAEGESLEKIMLYTGCTQREILGIQDQMRSGDPMLSGDVSSHMHNKKLRR